MTDAQTADQTYMQQAIDLAWQGLYTTGCNPRVGCVLVKDGAVIGRGFHVRPGEGHAEVNALADCTVDPSGATAYVTLEPCNHTGKTPPCSQALIAAKVARVVVAMEDPNPLVAGSGLATLRQAGIEVSIGLLEEQARALNPGFIKRMETGLPFVRIKLAMSLDGRTAMASGESQWITGPAARSDVQRLRGRSCAVVSGVDTVIADNASLTVRADEMGIDPEQALAAAASQPLRVVLDSRLRLPVDARLLSEPGPVLLVTTAVASRSDRESLQAAGAQVLELAADKERIALLPLLQQLAERQCNEVLVEAGATLAGAFVAAGLVDELVVYMAPTLLGSSARPLLSLELETMAQQQRLQIMGIDPVGDDWRIVARPV